MLLVAVLAALPFLGEGPPVVIDDVFPEICACEHPTDPFDLTPACDDYYLNESLIASAENGDRSALTLLRKRYDTADTFLEKHYIAAAILAQTNDEELWTDLVADAENLVRFSNDPDALAKFCEGRGWDSDDYMYMAGDALMTIANKPRARKLVERAIATGKLSDWMEHYLKDTLELAK